MSSGAALYVLLRRPVSYVWVPLAAVASLATIVLVAMFLSILGASLIWEFPGGAVSWTFTGLIGLLVGQAIKELLHCPMSWMLPGLRARLLPGALAIGLVVALFTREILVVIVAMGSLLLLPIIGESLNLTELLDLWASFPANSVGLVALSFLTFWIGVRPSPVNLVGMMAPMILLSFQIIDVVTTRGALVLALSAPLTAFLIYETFNARSARRRPFIPTQPLSGGGWSRSRKPSWSLKPVRPSAGRGADWRFGHLGPSVGGWIRAGWHENHGRWGRSVRIGTVVVPTVAVLLLAWMTVDTMMKAPQLWLWRGAPGVPGMWNSVAAVMMPIVLVSMVMGVPLVVFCACYGSISLQRTSLYPLSRRRLADVEYWASLAEALTICGLLAAILLGFWRSVELAEGIGRLGSWPPRFGSGNGWVLAPLRALAIVFVLTPVAQYFRLRQLRSPNPRGPVVQLLSVFALTGVLTWGGTMVAFRSIYILPRSPLLLHAAIFATAALLSQYIYRQEVHRYFKNADLV